MYIDINALFCQPAKSPGSGPGTRVVTSAQKKRPALANFCGFEPLVTSIATSRTLPGFILCARKNVAYSRRMTESPDDADLMLRYRDGDATAFETLYLRHNDSLYRYLLRMCRNRDSAEDLFQEVWRKIIESRNRYQPSAKFTTFLYRVAYNCFVDHTRRNKKYSMTDTTEVAESADDAEGPEGLAEVLIFRRRLNVAISRLPDEQRHAFLLHEEAGLGLDSIANVSGTTRETVKSRLRYANNKLRQALAEPPGAPDEQS